MATDKTSKFCATVSVVTESDNRSTVIVQHDNSSFMHNIVHKHLLSITSDKIDPTLPKFPVLDGSQEVLEICRDAQHQTVPADKTLEDPSDFFKSEMIKSQPKRVVFYTDPFADSYKLVLRATRITPEFFALISNTYDNVIMKGDTKITYNGIKSVIAEMQTSYLWIPSQYMSDYDTNNRGNGGWIRVKEENTNNGNITISYTALKIGGEYIPSTHDHMIDVLSRWHSKSIKLLDMELAIVWRIDHSLISPKKRHEVPEIVCTTLFALPHVPPSEISSTSQSPKVISAAAAATTAAATTTTVVPPVKRLPATKNIEDLTLANLTAHFNSLRKDPSLPAARIGESGLHAISILQNLFFFSASPQHH